MRTKIEGRRALGGALTRELRTDNVRPVWILSTCHIDPLRLFSLPPVLPFGGSRDVPRSGCQQSNLDANTRRANNPCQNNFNLRHKAGGTPGGLRPLPATQARPAYTYRLDTDPTTADGQVYRGLLAAAWLAGKKNKNHARYRPLAIR